MNEIKYKSLPLCKTQVSTKLLLLLSLLLWILLGLFSALLNAADGISCLLSSVCTLLSSGLSPYCTPVYLKVGQLVSASARSSLMRSSLIYSKQQGMPLICIRIHAVHLCTFECTVLAHSSPASDPNVLQTSDLKSLSVLTQALRRGMN